MKEIRILKSSIARMLPALLAGLLALVCMLVSCNSDDDGPTEVTFTVTYESEIGNPPAQITLPEGQELTSAELPELTAVGYQFLGWYIVNTESDALQDKKVQPGYKISENLKLKAKWQKFTYFINYVSEKGNYSKTITVLPDSVIDETLLAAPEISVEGYEFDGWYIGTTKIAAGTVSVGKDGVILTAGWKLCKITLSYYTDFSTAPESVTLDYGSSLEQSHLKTLFAADCTFEGWLIDNQIAAAGIVLTKDTVLVAKWTINGCPVLYRSEYGTVPKALILPNGTVLQEEHLEPLTADGYKFLGWYIGAKKVEAGTITLTDEGVTLTAQWEEIFCKITYTTEFASAPSSKTVKWGTLLSSETLPVLTCTGMTFKGWLFNGNAVDETFKVTDSITLTASWEKMICRITYESAHGSDLPQDTTLEYGSKLLSSMLPDLEDPYGIWEFKGWCVKNAVPAEPLTGGTYTVEGHVTLTAIWECRTGDTVIYVNIDQSSDTYLSWNQNWLEDRNCYQYEFSIDENFTSCKWYLDGKLKNGWNSNKVVLYSDEYPDCMYTLTVIATDSEGNRKSATEQVTIN